MAARGNRRWMATIHRYRLPVGGAGGVPSDVGLLGIPQLVPELDVVHGEPQPSGGPQHGQLVREVRRQHVEIPEWGVTRATDDRRPVVQVFGDTVVRRRGHGIVGL